MTHTEGDAHTGGEMMNEPCCRCPGCGECNAAKKARYSDLKSDGGMDPRNAADTASRTVTDAMVRRAVEQLWGEGFNRNLYSQTDKLAMMQEMRAALVAALTPEEP